MKTNKIIGHAVDATTVMETVDSGLVGTGTTLLLFERRLFRRTWSRDYPTRTSWRPGTRG